MSGADICQRPRDPLASDLLSLKKTLHDASLTLDQRMATGAKYNTVIARPYLEIWNKCPMFVKSDDLNRWKANYLQLADCFLASERKCSEASASSYIMAEDRLTDKLEDQGRVVSQWGLLRRAKYEITHLY